jgi:hypothetical protein
LRFAAAKDAAPTRATRAKAGKRPKVKNDPKHVAAARELRDRYLEHVNAAQGKTALAARTGKYDVSRILSSTLSAVEGSRALDAAQPALALPSAA